MTRFNYDKIVKIKRLKTTSGNLRAYVATATADASIQPLGKDRGQIREGVFGDQFVAFLDAEIPVQVGDRLTEDGVTYSVTQVVQRDFGAFPYKECVLKKS